MTRCFTIAAAAASILATGAVAQTPPPAAPTGKTRAFLDPLGKLWEVPGQDGLRAWFAAVDTNGDGKIDRAEITASAKSWFAALDLNHDGVIDPDEETAYESDRSGNHGEHAFARTGFGSSDPAPRPEAERGGRHGRHRGGGGGGGYDGGDRTGALMDVANPVISADRNMDRGVSEAEAVTAATRRLALLDIDGDGKLSLDEAITRREVQQGNARAKSRPTAAVDQPAPADGG